MLIGTVEVIIGTVEVIIGTVEVIIGTVEVIIRVASSSGSREVERDQGWHLHPGWVALLLVLSKHHPHRSTHPGLAELPRTGGAPTASSSSSGGASKNGRRCLQPSWR